MKKEFKLGDKVFDIRFGWGKVQSVENVDPFTINVYFENRVGRTYTEDGRWDLNENPILSHTEYSIHSTPSEFPKVMEVSNDGESWKKRVVVSHVDQMFGCFGESETMEEAMCRYTSNWHYAREIEEQPKELTLEEIAEKFGLDVKQIKIVK